MNIVEVIIEKKKECERKADLCIERGWFKELEQYALCIQVLDDILNEVE